ncbi:hypothetical protein ACFOOM_00405 [Streptomyces echinoruber]|uniref:Uncharacterized protein n=1 Tax=Streptomyces echinoruber TaxID=68898 RepID=A0A918QWM3_9ACTN|nr:hypothetical protein [Streptomyces echinoruber]GGZ74041.1 hypothetical protein GCM10010389_09610 [Streptomyces echinoruber]
MNRPGGHAPTTRATTERLTRAVRWAERLLCWTLAAGLAAAAVEALVRPGAAWWRAGWPVPWWLLPGWAALWAMLRARQKRWLRAARYDVPEGGFDRAA